MLISAGIKTDAFVSKCNIIFSAMYIVTSFQICNLHYSRAKIFSYIYYVKMHIY